jgi:hypothetical protein
MKTPLPRTASLLALPVLLLLATVSAPPSALAAGAAPTWGAPVAPPQKASDAADDDDDGRANGDYFHDFGELIVRVRSVRWIGEFCSDAFPAGAELQRRAYADWLQAHRPFVDEMEGQFGLIEKRWSGASPAARAGLSTKELQARLDANREALKEDFLARPLATQRKRCDAYPELLLSRRLDLEKSEADLVKSVRAGPR